MITTILSLLPGNSASAYQSIPGAFTPLIPISKDAVATKVESIKQLQEIIDVCTSTTKHNATSPRVVRDSITALGATPANADQSTIQATAKYARCDAIAQLKPGNQLFNAHQVLNAVMLAALDKSRNFLDQETLRKIKIIFTCDEMLKDGKIVAMTDDDSTVLEYYNVLMQKLENSVTNDLDRKLFEVAKSLVPGNGDNITTHKLKLFNAMIALAHPHGAAGVSGIVAPEGRSAVDILLDQACHTIDGLALHVRSQKRNTENSIANLRKSYPGAESSY